MAINGITAPISGIASGSGTGPKVREANAGIFQQVLNRLQETVGLGGNSDAEPSAEVGELRLQTTQFKNEFQRKLIQRLLELGVDLSQPFTLQEDGFGGVDVAGGHPDKDAIEQLFEEDSELRAEFSQLAGQAGRLYAADRNAFSTGDLPETGSSSFTSGSNPSFSLVVRDGQTEMAFLRS